MAESADPGDKGSHKNESILRWLKDVKMASQDVPRVSHLLMLVCFALRLFIYNANLIHVQ